MDRIIRSKLSGILVVLFLANSFLGCTCNECVGVWCPTVCSLSGPLVFLCAVACAFSLCKPICDQTGAYQDCTENPDECAATYEQLQLAAIEFCNEYPEECQEAFDTWVESFEEEAIE